MYRIAIHIFILLLLKPVSHVWAQDTLATVGNKVIRLNQFKERYIDFLLVTDSKDNIITRRSILNNQVNEILLKYYDDNDKILLDKEYLKEQAWAKKQALLAFLKDQEIYANIKVTEEEMRNAFKRINEKIAARHLFANTLDEANKLYDLLQLGNSFESLAKNVFSDSTLKNNGGYLGYFSYGDMDPVFEDTAYSLDVGEISKPVKTSYGYSIIQVLDKVSVPIITENDFNIKRSHIERMIKMRKKKSSEKAYIEHVFDDSKYHLRKKSLSIVQKALSNSGMYSENIDASDFNAIVAEYKDRIYTVREIAQKIDEIPASILQKNDQTKTLKSLVKSIIIQDVLTQIALKKNYNEYKVVKETTDKLLLNLFLKYKKNSILRNHKVSDDILQKYYYDNASNYMREKMIKIQEIILDNRSLADSIKNLAIKSANFGELAFKYSIRRFSGKNFGIWGFLPLDKTGPLREEFEKAKVGEIIGPLPFGDNFGIFKILAKKGGNLPGFSDIKGKVLSDYLKENSSKILLTYINNLRGKVAVTVNSFLLKSFEINY